MTQHYRTDELFLLKKKHCDTALLGLGADSTQHNIKLQILSFFLYPMLCHCITFITNLTFYISNIRYYHHTYQIISQYYYYDNTTIPSILFYYHISIIININMLSFAFVVKFFGPRPSALEQKNPQRQRFSLS